MTSTTREVPTDELLKVLANEERRTLLQHLRQNGADPVAVDELIDVLEPLDDKREDRHPDDARRQRRLTLQHVHFPRLDDIGTIDYDPHAATVHYTPVDQVEALLEFVTHELE